MSFILCRLSIKLVVYPSIHYHAPLRLKHLLHTSSRRECKINIICCEQEGGGAREEEGGTTKREGGGKGGIEGVRRGGGLG